VALVQQKQQQQQPMPEHHHQTPLSEAETAAQERPVAYVMLLLVLHGWAADAGTGVNG